MLAKENDYIMTKSGRKGTVLVELTSPELAYLIGFDDSEDIDAETVTPDDIVQILWTT